MDVDARAKVGAIDSEEVCAGNFVNMSNKPTIVSAQGLFQRHI